MRLLPFLTQLVSACLMGLCAEAVDPAHVCESLFSDFRLPLPLSVSFVLRMGGNLGFGSGKSES